MAKKAPPTAGLVQVLLSVVEMSVIQVLQMYYKIGLSVGTRTIVRYWAYMSAFGSVR